MHLTKSLFSSQNQLRLLGKKALITGGSQGIGLSIAKKFAEEGASVILLSRTKEKLESAVTTLPVHNPTEQNHSIAVFDIASKKTFNDTDIGTKLSTIDILVNSAGIAQSSLLLTTPRDYINDLVDTNLLGTIFSTQSMIKPMIRKKKGCIINISSVLGVRGVKGTSVYAATKAGVIGFTRSLAVELGSRNIRVNAICPGLVDTSMTNDMDKSLIELYTSQSPTKSLIPVEEISNAALTLALSDHMNGSVLTIDDGFTA
ncbi:uncharacterized protein SAPINGB_P003444 [Magnusiomyces paraingens]|uniref:3-oxoacyl-[acyl-carrier-protein] reductase n=1 Tax=Magnusiomyces paraingens TaxID=2606893 RepID=A0A5E8BQC5_9ASCO|nr:uncharacterized protein SAPINGB_P003444 [Saprochaete ingens]VVT53181.1 unnamed protein product [Saprochaete ingens]